MGFPVSVGATAAAEATPSGLSGEAQGIAARFAVLIEDAAKRGDMAEVQRLKWQMRQQIADAEGRSRGGGKGRGGRGGKTQPTPG